MKTHNVASGVIDPSQQHRWIFWQSNTK